MTFLQRRGRAPIASAPALALALAAFAMAPGTVHARGLIDNVNGIAFDDHGATVHFNGLLIDDHGKVEKLLQRTDKRPEKLDFAADGKGRTLLPGFVDAHAHVLGIGFQALTLDLNGTSSLDEALAKIAAYAAANPQRRWIVGTGWNQESWHLGRFPTAPELDKAVGDRPVWLERVDGHAYWANSKAMALAGITATTKAPPGGRIEKVAGKPSGIFVDDATALVDRVVPKALPKEYDLAFAKAQQILLSYGVTTVADMGAIADDWQAYRRAGDRGLLQVRVLAYALGTDVMLQTAGSEPTPWLYDDHLRMPGVKLLLDGALGSRGAWLKAPYSDAPGQTGLALLSPDMLRNQMSRAAMDGFQVAVHAIGDRANAELLDAIGELSETYTGDRRWRVEHAQIIDPADLPRFAQHGIIASMQPVHETSDWAMAEKRLGPDRLTGAYAWKTMIDNHVPLAFGTDAPVESSNPFPGLAAAISRTDKDGQPSGGWQVQQNITIEQALRAYSQGGAYAAFAEDRLGSLMPGHDADFILLDSDPTIASASSLRAMQVAQTWVGGRVQFIRKADSSGPASPAN